MFCIHVHRRVQHARIVGKREPNALASGRQGQINVGWLPEASAYGSREGRFCSFSTKPNQIDTKQKMFRFSERLP